MSETRVPAIPAPTDANLREVARAIKGVLDVREGLLGDPLDSNVKFRDLVDGGVVNVSTVRRGGASSVVITGPIAGGSDGYDPTADLTPPPAPTGFTATGLFAAVMLQWDSLPSTYTNHAYTEIWRAEPVMVNNTPTPPPIGNAVLIGTTDTRLYTDYLGNNATRYYWIRYVSQADIKGPYNSTNGTAATTAQNPALLISSLTGAITESQLYQDLGARINLIDGASNLPGSVNERIAATQSAVTALVTVPAYNAGRTYLPGEMVTYNGNLYKAIATTTGNLPTDATKWKLVGQYSSLANSFSAVFTDYLTTTETNSAISTATQGLISQTTLNNTLGSYATTATLVNDYYTKTATDSAISSATTNLVSTTTLNNTLGSYATTATLTNNYYTKTATDSAISSATQNLVSTATLNNTLGSYATTVALQTLATTTAGPNGTTAQYTVKIDNNGYVTGFGLSSTANNSAPTSNFGVRADAFYIANPAGPGIAPAMPFIVRTTPVTINGVSVPVGVYITDAFIQNGTITNAKIGDAAIDDAKIANLSADKITAGFINAARIEAESITAGKIDSRGLTIKDAAGNVVLASGTVVGSGNMAANGDFLIARTDVANVPLNFANYNNSSTSITNALLSGGPIGNAKYWRITVNAGGSSTMGFYFDSAASCFGGWKANTTYIVSFYARCNNHAGSLFQSAWNNGPVVNVALQNPAVSSAWQRYVWRINFGNNTIDPNGFFTISQTNLAVGTQLDFACIQVEQGDSPSGWSPAPISGLNPIRGANISTFIEAAAIKLAQIDTATIGSLSSLTANIGTLTAGVVRNAADTFRVDVDNGRTIARTGTYMKVTGIPFGSASQFIEWFGPYFANLSSCTEGNAVYYLKTNGSAYFGGTLSAGILTNRGATSDLGDGAEIIVGPFGTNGNTKTVTLSYSFGQQYTEYQGSSTGTGSGSISATVKLYRKIGAGSEAEVATLSVSGTWSYTTDPEPQPGPTYMRFWTQDMSGALTYTDSVSGTDNRTYRAKITARSLGFATSNGGAAQRVEVISVEQ